MLGIDWCASLRRCVGGLAIALCGLVLASRAAAEDVSLPVPLQIALLLKVASYDKNLAERAGDRVVVAVVMKPGDTDSARAGAQALSALSEADDIDGLPVEAQGVPFSSAGALARATTAERFSVLYVTPGFDDAELGAMAEALDGVSVLSVGAIARYAIQGTVLGIDLVGGKAKLLVNLARAKRQRVNLSSNALKLMRVVE